MKKLTVRLMAALCCLFSTDVLHAARIDTVLTYSPAMKKEIKAVLIQPSTYTSKQPLPVVYLLHGYGGNYANWPTNVPALSAYADQLNLLIVCPDGNIGSWYFDSPVDSSWKYETYISSELVAWIDSRYATIKDKSGRGITGLSMGGHGALFLAFRHPDVFGAAGSMSGGVDLTPFPKNWDLSKRLGTYAENRERWEAYSVINLTHLLTAGSPAIIINCGTEDFFYKVNLALHEELLYSNIPHDFITRPGAHNWDYWANAVGFQLMFMRNYFAKNRK